MTNEEQAVEQEPTGEEMVDSLPNALRAVAESLERMHSPAGTANPIPPPDIIVVLAVYGDQIMMYGSGPEYSRERHALALRTGLSDLVDGRGEPTVN